MQPEILAYAAGVLDSDGCITLGNAGNPIVEITNGDPGITNWFKETFSAGYVRQVRKKKYKPYYRWRVSGNCAYEVLWLLRPYMVHQHKKTRADIIIEYYDKLSKRPTRCDLIRREKMIAQVMRIDTTVF